MSNSSRDPWYADGLKFTCTQCGNCCTGAPGYVFVSAEEIARIAESLGQSALTPQQLRRVGRRWSLTEHRNGDCTFLKEINGKRICSIYSVRPLQCRTWPFWDSLLDTPETWAKAAKGCPGMNKGQAHTFVQIEVRRTAQRTEDLPT